MSPLVPVVVEQDARGERSSDLYSHLLRERIIFLGTPIDDQIANLTIAELLHRGCPARRGFWGGGPVRDSLIRL